MASWKIPWGLLAWMVFMGSAPLQVTGKGRGTVASPWSLRSVILISYSLF